MFFQYVIPLFETRNQVLQRGDPQIHMVYTTYYDLYEDLLQSFLDPDYITQFDDVSDIELDVHTIEYVRGRYCTKRIALCLNLNLVRTFGPFVTDELEIRGKSEYAPNLITFKLKP